MIREAEKPVAPGCFLRTRSKSWIVERSGATIGFAAPSTDVVDAFHKAGLAAGGKDEGAPGKRDHLPGAYAAYLRDPAGNKICSYTFTA